MSQANIDRELLRIANESYPYEACGFILADGTIVEVENVSKTPMTNFEMDRGDVILRLSSASSHIVGIWHTHPRGNCNPSPTDWKAFEQGAIKPEWDYYVVTPRLVNKIQAGTMNFNTDWTKFIA